MKIAITGATGFVGKNLRKFLSKQNIPVVAIGRKNFLTYKNEIKVVTKNYSEDLSSKLINCSCMVHLVGVGKQTFDNNYHDINFLLTKKILQISKKAKIKKIIFNSGLGASKNSTTDYFISKYLAEQEIIKSGLDYTIFRPSYIIGTSDHLSKNLKKQIRSGVIKIPGSGNFPLQPISINDVVKILFYAATSKKYSNKLLDLVGSEIISYEKFVKLFVSSTKTIIKKTDIEIAYRDAIRNPTSQYGVDDLHILVGNFIGSSKKLKQISNLEFESFRNILKSSSLS
ncbi:MAG: NAD-dependent epimerase/dehydratase family protein [Crenarchaeota archaeon]|nr:MAG: NAD-dependent epimerase/dehydratase family protein [Thermoproteota archaeon]RDJ33386.1 MAG: NAD-dependent epimerase/dehydratase family protein [Thermoproteota archaeon]RDJ36109.1 MAG: NAD-dependent epimerase/dehydratase family protein [Thermoproteota archaeon]RDJ38742.1 MAG: NAD-dependent epimerase/dehydratase family protein [Thermoproteota archaeon]